MTSQPHIRCLYTQKYVLCTAIYDFYNDLYNNLSDSYDCVCLWMASIIAILSLYGT